MGRTVTYTVADIRLVSVVVSPQPDGTVAMSAAYELLDGAGTPIPQEPLRHHAEALDGALTFSAVLPLTDQTLPGKAVEQVRVARDVVRDHVGDLLSWVQARIRQREGM